LNLDKSNYPEKIEISGIITKRKNEEYHINLSVSTVSKFPCDRCLKISNKNVNINVFFIYTRDKDLAGQYEDSDINLIAIDENEIDISKDIRDYIMLDKPMKIVCKKSCKGLCSECGTNLNFNQCSCTTEKIDPRWAKLKELYGN